MSQRWCPPTRQRQLGAIGIHPRDGKLLHQLHYRKGPGLCAAFKACKCCFEPGKEFEDIEPPQEGDWLAEHAERTPDQSFEDYVASQPNRPDAGRHTIYLLPICRTEELSASASLSGKAGTFPSLKALEEAVTTFFQMPVRRLRPQPMESIKFRPTCTPSREDRGFGSQWNARDVLDAIQERVPRDAFCVLAITMKDLYPRPEWNFVYGLAKLSQRVGVFSFVRHDPCAGRRDRDPLQESQLLCRSMGTLLHEIGHMFGIKHCTWFNCLMRGNNGDGIEHQKAPLHLCPVCLRKLHWNIGFDIVGRYQDLQGLYALHSKGGCEGFVQESAFLQARLQRLEGLPSTQLLQQFAWARQLEDKLDVQTVSDRQGEGRDRSDPSKNGYVMLNAKGKRTISEAEQKSLSVYPEANKWRDAIEAIYRDKAPAHLGKIDGYLEKYRGKEEHLYQRVCKTYGVESQSNLA